MKKGFTLLELLVVVLIIGVLGTVALPMYKKAVAKAKAAQFVPLVDSVRKARTIHPLLENTKEDIVFYDSGWNYKDGSVGEEFKDNLSMLGVDFPYLKELEQKFEVRLIIRKLENDPGLYLQIEPTDHGKGFIYGDYEMFTGGHRFFCHGAGDIGVALAQIYHCDQ